MSTENRTTLIVFALVLVAVIAGGILLVVTRPAPVAITVIPPEPTATPLPTNTPAPITVYVTGAVADAEQLVTLPAGSRVTDAVDAAGGLLPEADTTLVNLADLLRDGDQIHVPFAGTVQATPEAGITDNTDTVREELDLPTPVGGTVINVNTATAEELTALPGIGQVTAEAIIAYREENGPFASLQDLDEVSGIGPSTLENIAAQVVFE
jgi:competence protein ComEA